MTALPPLSILMIAVRETGTKMVTGYDLGLFAVTPDLQTCDDGYWVVTHLLTGYRFSTPWTTFAEPEQAADYARRLEATVPVAWHSSNPDDFDLKDYRCAAVRLALECGAMVTDRVRPADVQEVIDDWEDAGGAA